MKVNAKSMLIIIMPASMHRESRCTGYSLSSPIFKASYECNVAALLQLLACILLSTSCTLRELMDRCFVLCVLMLSGDIKHNSKGEMQVASIKLGKCPCL